MALKAIWNDKNKPEWFGHYTLNSEGPKPYWTCEAGNMAECLDPVTNFVEELAVNGAKTAQVNYGCRGWVAHHNTDLWKHSSLVGAKGLATYYCSWMFDGVFMTQLLWDHYKFSGDKKYLRDRAYPIMMPRGRSARRRAVPFGHCRPVVIVKRTFRVSCEIMRISPFLIFKNAVLIE